MNDDVATGRDLWRNAKVSHYLALRELGELFRTVFSEGTALIDVIDSRIRRDVPVENEVAEFLPELTIRQQACLPVIEEMLYHIHRITTDEQIPPQDAWWRGLSRYPSDQVRQYLAVECQASHLRQECDSPAGHE